MAWRLAGRQAMIWINDGKFTDAYAPLGLNDLRLRDITLIMFSHPTQNRANIKPTAHVTLLEVYLSV